MENARVILLCALALVAGCASPSTQPAISIDPRDAKPNLVSFGSFAQPATVIPPSGTVSVVNWTDFQWTDSDTNVTFNLYYGFLSPHEYDYVITGITNLDEVVSNMVPGITYYLAATAVDTNGVESEFSPQYVYLMPTTLEIGFLFNQHVGSVSVQSSTDLATWQSCDAIIRTNGLWRVDVDTNSPVKFYRGVASSLQ